MFYRANLFRRCGARSADLHQSVSVEPKGVDRLLMLLLQHGLLLLRLLQQLHPPAARVLDDDTRRLRLLLLQQHLLLLFRINFYVVGGQVLLKPEADTICI